MDLQFSRLAEDLNNLWSTRLEWSDLPSGMYWIKVFTEKGVAVQKVVIVAKN